MKAEVNREVKGIVKDELTGSGIAITPSIISLSVAVGLMGVTMRSRAWYLIYQLSSTSYKKIDCELTTS